MKYRKLGNTGLSVSTLCLGTMTFGEADENSFMHKVGCDEPTSHAILDAALEAGINFIDTADVYGQDGLSERVIGNWFAKGDGRRDRTVLATKFRFVMGEGPNKSGAARYRIVKCVEDSLRRLQTDHIDLYQIHMQDLDTPEDELLRALDDLVTSGKVLYTGCSNYAAWRLVDSQWRSRTQNRVAFVTQQMQYSLLERGLEREHVSIAREFGVGILPWSPLAGGFLTGKYRKDATPPEGTRLDKWRTRYDAFDTERNWRTLDAVLAVAEETGATASQVSLAWLIHKPGVSSVIFGARTMEQLEGNLPAGDLELSDEQMTRLDEASDPGREYPYTMLGRVQNRW
ncbi:MAG: aldo/keto reductase [Deltaproteobacteria bacterium]|nr:aldo/keto reductase [Deltaproteobacteria bacterium]